MEEQTVDENALKQFAQVPADSRFFAGLSLLLSVFLLLHAARVNYWDATLVRCLISVLCAAILYFSLRLRTLWFFWGLVVLAFYNPFIPLEYLPEVWRWCSAFCACTFIISAWHRYSRGAEPKYDSLRSWFAIHLIGFMFMPGVVLYQLFTFSCYEDVSQIYSYYSQGKKDLALGACRRMLASEDGLIDAFHDRSRVFDIGVRCANAAFDEKDISYAKKFEEVLTGSATNSLSLSSNQYHELAKLCWKLTDEEKALQIVEIGRKRLREDYDRMGEAALFYEFGDFDRGKEATVEAIALLEQPYSELSIDDFVVLSIGLSRILERQAQHQESIILLRDALRTCESSQARLCVKKLLYEELSKVYEKRNLMAEALAAEREVTAITNLERESEGETSHYTDDEERPKPFDVTFEPHSNGMNDYEVDEP